MRMDTTIYPRAGGQADFDFYKYNPSRPAGWTFCILFAIATVVHLGYIVPYRSWFFIPFTLGCAGRSPESGSLHHVENHEPPANSIQLKQAATMADNGLTTTFASEAHTSYNSSFLSAPRHYSQHQST